MDNLKWDSQYSVSIGSIDDQHKQLVEIINNLIDILNYRKQEESIILVIQKLINYTVKHFQFEEKLFKLHSYQDAKVHKKEHDDFIEKITDFERQVISDNKKISPDLLSFLVNWLVNHIMKEDKKYIPLFKENKVQ